MEPPEEFLQGHGATSPAPVAFLRQMAPGRDPQRPAPPLPIHDQVPIGAVVREFRRAQWFSLPMAAQEPSHKVRRPPFPGDGGLQGGPQPQGGSGWIAVLVEVEMERPPAREAQE